MASVAGSQPRLLSSFPGTAFRRYGGVAQELSFILSSVF
jgi:hypothetical protein